MRVLVLSVLALVLAPVLALLTVLAPGLGTVGALPARAAAAPADATAPQGRVVLLGVPSLRWDELDERATPHLWRLAREGSAGALSVRAVGTVACPIDGWLTVSAGTRSSRPGGPCDAPPPAPVTAGEGAVVPDFATYRDSNVESKFRSPVGLLGGTVRQAGGCTTAVGPGGALALADPQGRVDVYVPSAAQVTAAVLARCPVTAVDLDDLLRSGDGPGARAAAVRRADAAAGRVLAALPAATTVLVSGISDGPSAAGPHLRVAIAAGPGIPAASYLTSDSTRRDGIVITPDVTATMLVSAGLAVPTEVIGTPWRGEGRRLAGEAGVTELARHDVAAQTYKSVLPRFFLGLVISQVAFYLVAMVILRRRQDGGGRRRVLAVLRVVALACAAVPVSTYLVNLLPWWRGGPPEPMLLGGIAAFDALIVTVALAGPWRRTLLGPGTVVTAVTAATVGLDLLTGTRLQLYSLMGYSPLVGGRYYGLGNIAFSVFATSILLTGAGLAQWLVGRGAERGDGEQARRWAVAAVLALGTLAMALDGLPLWGADFGGVIAIVPGLAVAAMMVAGRRISLVRLAVFCAVGGVLVLSIAYLDHLRGSSTHLGRFFGELLAGEAGPTVERKFGAMMKTMLNPTLTPIAAAALVLLFMMLRRPGRMRAPALEQVYAHAPLLRAGLMGALATAVVGTLVNDSGMAVLALALVVAVPLALAAGAHALQPVPAVPGGETPDAPKASDAPKAPETPETPDAPEAPAGPVTP
ncbi:hypothetical protein SAMN04489712_103327 [Thermomonospora echinospora]|uniref:Uncharacterized protein n=1 Tax=Thermomonospora echinospora TaxID=1992 RepID=A0A1H5XN88_9ACTN|nr:hypothetical protein [Thermomonospora echinospora]SEG13113.1 hypothetical protein SAMN04489712_103327 [Thermomonospora echinospora]